MDDYFTLTKIQNQQLKARFSINTELITDLIDNYCSISEVIQKEEKTKTHIRQRFQDRTSDISIDDYLLIHGRTPQETKNYMENARESLLPELDCYNLDHLSYMLFLRTDKKENGFILVNYLSNEAGYAESFEIIREAMK